MLATTTISWLSLYKSPLQDFMAIPAQLGCHHTIYLACSSWPLKKTSFDPIPAFLNFVLPSFHLVIDGLADEGESLLNIFPSFG